MCIGKESQKVERGASLTFQMSLCRYLLDFSNSTHGFPTLSLQLFNVLKGNTCWSESFISEKCVIIHPFPKVSKPVNIWTLLSHSSLCPSVTSGSVDSLLCAALTSGRIRRASDGLAICSASSSVLADKVPSLNNALYHGTRLRSCLSLDDRFHLSASPWNYSNKPITSSHGIPSSP